MGSCGADQQYLRLDGRSRKTARWAPSCRKDESRTIGWNQGFLGLTVSRSSSDHSGGGGGESGGQRQRFSPLVGLPGSDDQPSFLMLDEPTAGVSPIVMDELFDPHHRGQSTGIPIFDGGAKTPARRWRSRIAACSGAGAQRRSSGTGKETAGRPRGPPQFSWADGARARAALPCYIYGVADCCPRHGLAEPSWALRALPWKRGNAGMQPTRA